MKSYHITYSIGSIILISLLWIGVLTISHGMIFLYLVVVDLPVLAIGVPTAMIEYWKTKNDRYIFMGTCCGLVLLNTAIVLANFPPN